MLSFTKRMSKHPLEIEDLILQNTVMLGSSFGSGKSNLAELADLRRKKPKITGWNLSMVVATEVFRVP